MSPRAWKASFSEFHRNYTPKTGQRFSFRSPDKPRHGSLSRETSSLGVSPQSYPPGSPTCESRDLDAGSCHSEIQDSAAQDDTVLLTAGNEPKTGEDSNQVYNLKGVKEEEPAGSCDKEESEKAPPSESSCELNNSCDSESLDLQLSAEDNGPLHIEEREDSPVAHDSSKPNVLENGEVSGFNSETQELVAPHKV